MSIVVRSINEDFIKKTLERLKKSGDMDAYNVIKTLINAKDGWKNVYEYLEPSSGKENQKAIKVVLTIAHLDHDTSHNDYSNLKALCQRCHLNYDKEHHKRTRKYGNNTNQMELL